MHEVPFSMLPAAQLEALLGAILARMLVFGSDEFECKIIGEYEKLNIVGL